MSGASDRPIAVANARAAGALVAALVDGGVRAAVLSPGSRNTPLLLALAAHPDVETWPVLDERVAGFFALGLARASGRPVVLSCTSGSAGAHYLPAVIEADRARVPLVVLTADRPPELHGCNAPQTLDQRRLFGAFARLSRDLPPPGPYTPDRALRSAASDAVGRALGRPPGPVHLNCLFREPLWAPGISAEYAPAHAAGSHHHRGVLAPSAADVHAIVNRCVTARRGVIVCGPEAAPDDEAAAAIVDLGATLGWPVLAEAASGVRFAVAADATIATYDALLRGPFGAAHRPDAVLRFGRTATSKPLTKWLAAHAVDRLVLVDPAGERHDPDHLADLLVSADPAPLARAVADALPADRPRDTEWVASWRRADTAARAEIDDATSTGWWSGAIARAIVEALPDGGALHAANSMPVRDVDGFCLPGAGPRRVLVSRGANGIDGTTATAAGEALALAPRPLVLMTGDLSALHDAGGLLHAGAIGAPLTVVVVDNGGGGIFEYLPIAAHPNRFERLFITPQPTRFEPLCAAAGARYVAVDGLAGLKAGLAEAIERPGVDVLHAVIDRADDLARHRAVWAAVAPAEAAR